LRDADRIAIIDTGTAYSVPQIKQGLESLGLEFSNVDLIILTHIHLDHAGGSSLLMKLCPNAQLIVHPKGARHMAEPEKLIAGTIAVYGEAEFKKIYDTINPIDPKRIVIMQDGQELDLGKRTLKFIDSPGHANHHHCIVDIDTNSIFTGDTLGIAYRALRDPDHAFVMPTTTPVQFNPDALHQSIDKVMAYNPDWLYYTHYSALKPSPRIIAGLHEKIDDYVRLTQIVAERDPEDFAKELGQELFEHLTQCAKNELSTVSDETIEHWVKMDAFLDAQGLAFWWQYRRESTPKQ
jgi:glyoxylase-like metal-dependent hydrolase (beta-lactamase superfamily II)